MPAIRRSLRREHGVRLFERILLLAAILVAIIGTFEILGHTTQGTFASSAEKIGSVAD